MLTTALTALALLVAPKPAPPAPETDLAIPSLLKPWVPWVLYNSPGARCPFLQASADQSDTQQCTWPGELSFALAPHGATFRQVWSNLGARPVLVPLPGDAKHWPLQVALDGRPAALIANSETPALLVSPGSHLVSGGFEWSGLPEGLSIPDAVGLLSATRGGKLDTAADWSKGKLWLHAADANPSAAESDAEGDAEEGLENPPPEPDTLTITVNRLVQDDVPLWLTTSIELVVSGKSREELLGPALPAGAEATQIESPLPVRLEADGSLRTQLKRGTYVIEIHSHQSGPVTELAAPKPSGPWSAAELWAFEPQEALHHLEVKGAPSVDPQQTRLPDAWRSLRTFKLAPGDALSLVETRRGAPEPQADALYVSRELWLDLDGQGYSVHDQLAGQVHQGWRLELPPPFALGEGLVDGRNRLITQVGESGAPGVELRSPALQLSADSRLVGSVSHFPAVGWAHPAAGLKLSLHLPPGWRLLHAIGADQVRGSLAGRWALADLILALIAVAWVARLRGLRWGLVALLAVALTFEETGAPRLQWLALLALETAWQLAKLRPTALRNAYWQALRAARVLMAGVLVLGAAGFATQQLRAAFDPQLSERAAPLAGPAGFGRGAAAQDASVVDLRAPLPRTTSSGMAGKKAKTKEEAKDAVDNKAAIFQQLDGDTAENGSFFGTAGSLAGSLHGAGAGAAATAAPARPSAIPADAPVVFAETVDPKAVVQTGAGVPTWQWSSVELGWTGTVPANQQVTLWLIPAWLEQGLSMLRVVLLLALWLGILGVFSAALRTLGAALRNRGAPGIAAVGLLAVLSLSGAARAETTGEADATPIQVDGALLKALAARLAARPACGAHCADFQKLSVEATPNHLRLVLEATAATPTAVALPGDAEQWRPTGVKLDGSAAVPVRRDDGKLWIRLPVGLHTIELTGPLPHRSSVALSLPLAPHRVRSSLRGWTLAGVDAEGVPEGDLQLTRGSGKPEGAEPDAADTDALASENLPGFSLVTRLVHLGLTWKIDTTVERLSPVGKPFALEIPLEPGERLTTDGLHVLEGKVQINFGATEQQKTFESELKQQSPVVLTAPTSVAWTERWELDQSPMWHVEQSGVPMLSAEAGSDSIRPTWLPWPGEALSLAITKPAPTAGQSFTIDDSAFVATPGERETTEQLTVDVRTTRAQPYVLTLPGGVQLKSLTLNGAEQVVAHDQPTVSVDLSLGANRISALWTRAVGFRNVYRSPSLDLGVGSVNPSTSVVVPEKRWLLWLGLAHGGRAFGPTLLLWGVLGLCLVLALLLAALRLAPLRAVEWLLLLVGLLPLVVGGHGFWGLVPIAWLLAVGYRRQHALTDALFFNASQVALAGFGAFSLALLFQAVRAGVTEPPPMFLEGAQSQAGVTLLSWVSDRVGPLLPQVTVISLPAWAYQVATVAWVGWLVFAARRWLPWLARAATVSGNPPTGLADLWRPMPGEPKAPWVPLQPLPPLEPVKPTPPER